MISVSWLEMYKFFNKQKKGGEDRLIIWKYLRVGGAGSIDC